jgi:hypothetical protein
LTASICRFVEYFIYVDISHGHELVFLHLQLYAVDFVSHLINPSFDDQVGLRDPIVQLMQLFELLTYGGVLVVVLEVESCLPARFRLQFLNALEGSPQSLINLVVCVVNGLLADGVDLGGVVEHGGMLHIFGFPEGGGVLVIF